MRSINPALQHSSTPAAPLPCFIRPLRDAIRRGEKTETRRVLDPQPTQAIQAAFPQWGLSGPVTTIGARYYLREPLQNVNGYAHYADDAQPVLVISPKQKIPNIAPNPKAGPWREHMKWQRVNGQNLQRNTLPQIHMPATAARTFVRLKNIWTERLHQITEAGALAEGITCIAKGGKWTSSLYQPPGNIYAGNNERLGSICGSARLAFQALWDAINAQRDGGQWAWKNNPYVIVRQFTLEK